MFTDGTSIEITLDWFYAKPWMAFDPTAVFAWQVKQETFEFSAWLGKA